MMSPNLFKSPHLFENPSKQHKIMMYVEESSVFKIGFEGIMVGFDG